MADGIVMALQALAAFSLLVLVHELGHFFFARMFGVRVLKFYIFFDLFGIKLFKTHIGHTEFGVGWLPLGGYVRLAGMLDEGLDAPKPQAPQPWEFTAKPPWQRLIIILGGIIFNTVFGFLAYAFTLYFLVGSYIPAQAVTDGIWAGPLAQKAGLQTHDRILYIDGRAPHRFEDITAFSVLMGSQLTVLREHDTLQITIPDKFILFHVQKTGKSLSSVRVEFIRPYSVVYVVDSVLEGSSAWQTGLHKNDTLLAVNDVPVSELFGLGKTFGEYFGLGKGDTVQLLIRRADKLLTLSAALDSTGRLGIFFTPHYPYPVRHYTLGEALHYGIKTGIEALYANTVGLALLLTGQLKLGESVHSPIGIATYYGGNFNWERFWSLTALLSLVLALINLLPIPALDGSYALIYLIEAITGYKPSTAFMRYFVLAGVILLVAIMLYAVVKDILALIGL